MSNLSLRLHTLQRAVQAFADTPGRTGRLVRLQDAEDVLVIGDMHGNVDNFRRLLNRAMLAQHPRRHLVVQELIHSPHHYPGGGDKSHQLVDLICALKCQYPERVHYLIGNHELSQATGRAILKYDEDLNEQFHLGVQMAYGEAGEEVYQLYLQLFAVLPFAVRTQGRVFLCHSVPATGPLERFELSHLEREPTPEDDLRPGGCLYALVWGRDVTADHVETFLHKVDADILVTGHIPCPDRGYDQPSPRHVILDGQGSPAGLCLLPANHPILPEELPGCIEVL